MGDHRWRRRTTATDISPGEEGWLEFRMVFSKVEATTARGAEMGRVGAPPTALTVGWGGRRLRSGRGREEREVR
jgi:hypothetical protein